jgi:zona occludens toxin (predicted ATPase)
MHFQDIARSYTALYTRGRHNSISTITATQKFAAIAPIIRVNATELYIYRLRNYKDLGNIY